MSFQVISDEFMPFLDQKRNSRSFLILTHFRNIYAKPPFIDLVEQNGLVLCHRACKKMNSCNNPRHRCKNVCCTENHDAQCLIPCGAKLSCKEHSCPEACHFGRSCLPCMNITWTELSCRCGSQKLLQDGFLRMSYFEQIHVLIDFFLIFKKIPR